MVDYVKILVKGVKVSNLLENPILDFKSQVSTRTGELSNKLIAEYFFCKITIYDGRVVLFTGSIHKLWNALNNVKAPNRHLHNDYKGYNGNDFDFAKYLEVRIHLEELFNTDSDNFIIQNIEFGVNLNTSFDPKNILEGLLLHKGKSFEYRYKNNYAQCVHNRFILKIYNKGDQYGMGQNILRVELKIVKMQELKSKGVISMADINESTLKGTESLLLRRWGEIVYYDSTIRKKELNPSMKRALRKYSNPRFWLSELKPHHRDRHKKRLNEINSNHSSNLKERVSTFIKEKCVIINRLRIDGECVKNNHSNIGLVTTQSETDPNERYCQLTGLDISMQKEDSFLLSHAGLKHLYHKDMNRFEEVKKQFLTRKWIGSDFQTQIREIAHGIRDRWRRYKAKYERGSQLTLFMLDEVGCNSSINHFINNNLSKVEKNRWTQN